MMRQLLREDVYNVSLYWILRERAGGGGWPPNDVSRVAGWTVIRMLAAVHNKPVREVAADLIERYQEHGDDVSV